MSTHLTFWIVLLLHFHEILQAVQGMPEQKAAKCRIELVNYMAGSPGSQAKQNSFYKQKEYPVFHF